MGKGSWEGGGGRAEQDAGPRVNPFPARLLSAPHSVPQETVQLPGPVRLGQDRPLM